MTKNRSKLASHPDLFDPIPKSPQWEQLPLAIRQQIGALLIQLFSDHAARKLARIEKEGTHE
jgi:hypothetical protein